MDAFSPTGTSRPAAILTVASGWHRLRHLLSSLAYRAVERITLPQRDLPPEFYRFPPY